VSLGRGVAISSEVDGAGWAAEMRLWRNSVRGNDRLGLDLIYISAMSMVDVLHKQTYIVYVQALSVDANDKLVSLSFLQATVAKHWRGIDIAVFCIQWLWKRCDRIRRLHGGHVGRSMGLL